MTTIVKRIAKGSTLTVSELDANVTNLNNTKLETTGGTLTGLPVLANQDVNIISPVYPTTKPSLNLDFTRGQLDPRITFVRNSTAAYYDGRTTAKAEENLLSYSQDFRNTADAGSTRPWLYLGITNTYGAAIAPDGTTTANYLQETATTAIHILSSSTVNSVTLGSTAALTCSIYFKKGLGSTAPDWIQINTGGASNCYASFNLTTGLVGNYGGGSGISATNPINVGAGWYRCIITLATAGSGVHYFYPGFTNNTNPTSRYPSYLGIITSDVQAWGFQIEQRSSATAYTPTTTAAITNYIPVLMTAPAGVARFDCDPITGKSLGLLIEESRTNLLTYSSNFVNWIQGGANTIVSDCIIAPDGTLTGDSLYTSASNIYKSISVTSGTVYTRSVYAKKGTSSIIGWEATSAGSGTASFNFDTLAVTNNGVYSGMSAVSVGNGWYRISAQITPTLTATMTIYQYGGTDFGNAGASFIWGAQLEAGSFATSLIPTVASTVTRAADQASMTGTNFSSWYNQSQGSFYVEVDSSAPNTAFLSLVDWGTSQSNRNTSSFNNGYLNFGAVNSSVASMASQVSVIRNNTLASKNSVSYTNTISFICKDGTATSNSSAGTLYNAANMFLTIGARIDYGVPINGHIRKLSYYPVALSSANLVALTS